MTDRAVRYRIQADLGDFQAKMKQGSESAKQFGNDLMALDKNGAQMRAGLSHVGDVAGRIGVVAAAGLGMAVKSAMDWETAWTGVLKTVDGTPEQLARLEDGLRGLAVETGFAHEEVAGVAEAAGQLGISTGGIEAFTRTMLDMGVSTNLSSEEAATGLARLRNIMGTTEGEIRNTGSAMVELGNNFATTEGEILAMSLRIAGAGRQAGLTTADVLGLSTAMSSVGIEAEAGGTAISLTMKRIEKSVSDGDDTLGLFAETAGMTAEQFATQWGEDAPGALTAFVAGLGKAEASGTSANAVLRELGITGIREADALLRLSGNAEGLADALATSADGFEKNAALAEEAGKFYDTTGQQAKQSWAAIKDAAIDAGDSMLPVVEGIANGIAGLAGAFQELPGPVKAAVGPMLGITAILGGGTWFAAKAISGVVDMRQALSDLNATAPKSATVIGKVGRAATIAAAAFAGFAIADAIQDIGKEIPTVEEMTKRLIELSQAKIGKDLADDFADLGEAFEDLSGMNWFDDLNNSLADLVGMGHVHGEAIERFEQMDAALASLAGSGNADVAAAAVDNFAKSQNLSAEETEALMGLLPAYQDALTGIENDAALAEGSTTSLGNAMDGMGNDAGAAAEEVQALTDAMKESRAEALRAADAEINYHASLDDARAALKANGRTLDVTTEKGRANRSALIDLAGSWNNLSDEQKNAQGASRSARAEFVRIATQMGMTKREARQYADQLMEIPSKRVTDVAVNTGAAYAELGALAAHLDWVTRPRSVRITTSGTVIRPGETRNADGGVWDYYADGGFSENHVAQIAPAGAWRVWAEPETGGEAYIPLSPAKRERSVDIWEETGRRLGVLFADGGFTGGGSRSGPMSVNANLALSDQDISRIAAAVAEGSYAGAYDGTAQRDTTAYERDRAGSRLGR